MLISSLSETAARYLIQIIAADQKPPRNQQQFYQSFQQFLMKKKCLIYPTWVYENFTFCHKETTSVLLLIWMKNIQSACFLAQVFNGGVYLLLLQKHPKNNLKKLFFALILLKTPVRYSFLSQPRI